MPDRLADSVAANETSELRWFTAGLPADEVMKWFTGHGRRGDVEVRRDLYAVDGRHHIGVKMRGRVTTELKLRRSVGAPWAWAGGPTARVEVWNKWSPADALVDVSSDQSWIEVRKRIVRRRFTADGLDDALTGAGRSMDGVGCDAEIATIEIGRAVAWSFALAAFGPTATRRTSITAALRALRADGAPVTGWLDERVVSCGYPEWIASRVHSAGLAMEPGHTR